MLENYETYKDTRGEETVIEHSEGKEYAQKSLPNTMPNLEAHIKELEAEGWNIFKRGERFVVMERTQEDQYKKETYH